MEPDQIPSWVPPAVKRMAAYMHSGNERLSRFLIDERMRSVWAYLTRHRIEKTSGERIYAQKVNVEGFTLVPAYNNLTEVGVHTKPLPDLGIPWRPEFSIQEQACAALYLAVFEVAFAGDMPLRKSFLDDVTEVFTRTAENCRWLKAGDHFPQMHVSDEVKNALEIVEKHCEDRRRFYGGDNNPRRVSSSSGLRGNDIARGHVRKLACTTRALFGNVLAGQLMTIANVVLAPAKPITRKTVENWTADLPPPQSGR